MKNLTIGFSVGMMALGLGMGGAQASPPDGQVICESAAGGFTSVSARINKASNALNARLKKIVLDGYEVSPPSVNIYSGDVTICVTVSRK